MALTKKKNYLTSGSTKYHSTGTFSEEVIKSDGNILCIFVRLSANSFEDKSCLNYFLEQRMGINESIRYGRRVQ